MKRAADNSRLHVSIGFSCNNNCVFCMEGDRGARAQREGRITPEVIRALLRGHGTRGQVMFTSGEPTLHPLLPDFIAAARDEGYATIAITTNGRRLAYRPYARALVERGLNHVVVSIHGADAKHHDAQTRAPGSFAQAIDGLRSLAALKASHALSIHTSTVVNRRNLGRLTDVYRTLAAFPIDQLVFNVIKPDGRAAALFDRLVPRFGEVRAAFDALLAAEPVAAARVFLVDMPPCTTEDFPGRVRGWVERYQYFEAEDETPGRVKKVLRIVDGGRILASDRRGEGVAMVKGPPCIRCAARRRCDGIWAQYAGRYGWAEFKPVPPARAQTRRTR